MAFLAPAVPAIASGVGTLLSGAAKGSAQNQAGYNEQLSEFARNLIAEQNAQNNAALQRYADRNNANTAMAQVSNQIFNTKNDIATKNPSTFARQATLAGIVANTPAVKSTGAASYSGPGESAKSSLAELQRQAITNLLESPDKNPVPSAKSVAAPTWEDAPALAANPDIAGLKPKQPGTGVWDKILGGAGLGASLIGVLGKREKK